MTTRKLHLPRTAKEASPHRIFKREVEEVLGMLNGEGEEVERQQTQAMVGLGSSVHGAC